MVLFPRGRRARTFGTYSGVRVDSAFSQQVIALLEQGIGTVRSRELLRSAGFRFRDSSFDAIRRESRLISIRGSRLNNLRLDARPGPNTLVQTNREFGRNFQYSSRVTIFNPLTGDTFDMPVQFGDDRLLTRQELIERAESIVEQSIANSGPESYGEESVIGDVFLTGAMARAPR